MIFKTCTCCGEEKFLSGFHKSRKRKDGSQAYKAWCQGCCSIRDGQYKIDDLEKVQESKHKSYLKRKNKPQYILEYGEEEIVDKVKVEKERKERDSISSAIYYQLNRDKILERNSKRAKENPAGGVARTAKYRASKLQATPSWCEVERIKKKYEFAEFMGKMMNQDYHIDHIVPLQGELVCGLHCIANLQILPAAENIAKSNKFEIT